MLAAAVTTVAADISFTTSRNAHNMHATANRIIVLGGEVLGNDNDSPPSPDVVHEQNIIASSVSAMDYGTGQTADIPVTPLDSAYNALNSYGAACDYDARTKYIQCFGGGLTGSRLGQFFNILSTFDTTTLKWIRAVQYSDISPRDRAAGVVLGSSFYLYGGDGPGGQILADFLCIDLTTYTLTRINASGTSPGARLDHCMAALSDTQFIMHGGTDGVGNAPNNSAHPLAPFGHWLHRPQRFLYRFGGADPTSRNDLWVLEPLTRTWRGLSPHNVLGVANVPSPRYYIRLVTLGKYLVTYGGVNALRPIPLSTDKLLYFYNTQTGMWVNSSDVLSDPWFKGLSPPGVGTPPEGQGRDKGADERGVNVAAVAGGVVAGIVLIVAVVGGI
ncbi:Acyl-CoA-binding domain-containing protein 5, partial [Borealophlyctis nickersoniae]